MSNQYKGIEIRYVVGWGGLDDVYDVEKGGGGFSVGWSCPDIGFGEVQFSWKEGKFVCDSECMSKEFVSAVMNRLITLSKFKDFEND